MTLWQLWHPPACVNGKVGNPVQGVRNNLLIFVYVSVLPFTHTPPCHNGHTQE